MEKKITISENLYTKLLMDKEDFNYIESNNDFYCDVIINTYNFDNRYKQMEKIINLLSGKNNDYPSNEIIASIKKQKDKYMYREWLNQLAFAIIGLTDYSYPLVGDRKEIFIRETERTQGKLEKILEEFSAFSAAEIFKNIIGKYISYPAYIREQIIYHNNYQEISECIKKKIKCKITTNKGTCFIIEPYKLLPGKDEAHNYITCYSIDESGKFQRSIQSYKLSTISKICKLFDTYCFTEEESNTISTRLKENGPAYISSKLKEFKIELDQRGQNLFNSIEKDRPTKVKTELGKIDYYNNKPQQYLIYTLHCTEFQILNYLKQFSYHVTILNDDVLKRKLFEYYEKAYTKFK